MRTIARGFAGIDHVDIAWTDHTGTATQYLELRSDEGIFAVMDFLARESINDYQLVMESPDATGSTFRVDVPEF